MKERAKVEPIRPSQHQIGTSFGYGMVTKIPQFNLNHFKVFMAVYETLSMTEAATNLHLTQSGVSQHIKALETDLGSELFTRVGRKIIPTALANQLHPDIQKAFHTVTERLSKISGKDPEPEGVVRLGMPIEYGTNVIVPKLAKLGQKYPKISFEITLDYASVTTAMVVNGQLDFAYVDEAPMDRRLQYQVAATENLYLCGSREYMSKKPKVKYTQTYFEGLEYIEYKGADAILRRWMLHHLKRKNLRLNVRAHIMDVQGVAKFIASNLGVGVLPDQMLTRLQKDGVDLFVFDGKSKPLKNEMRLIRLKGEALGPTAKLVFQDLN